MNQKTNKQAYLLMTLSIAIAFVLNIIPLPHWAAWYRPCWVIMLILAWQINKPQQLRLTWVWLLGLMMDALYGNALGMHAFAYILVYYFASKCRHLLRVLPVIQQTSIIGVLILINEMIITLFQVLSGDNTHTFMFLYKVASSTALWPMVFLFTQDLSNRYAKT